ncbi:hypothetical protein, partial [Actinophytocola sediminis]
PGAAAEWRGPATIPGAVAAVAGSGVEPGELAAAQRIADALRAGAHGFSYLDTDSPAAIAAFERAFLEVADDIELLSAGRRPWRRWWRRRSASRGPVAAAGVARLLAAARPVPRMVLNVDSTVFVKAAGTRIVTRTMTSAQLRRFEHGQRLRADPVAAALDERAG